MVILRLPAPVRAVATTNWPGRDSSDMPIFKHQPLLVVSLEGDFWVKVTSTFHKGSDADHELYVPRAYVEFLEPVSGVTDDGEIKKVYRNWVDQTEAVMVECITGENAYQAWKERQKENEGQNVVPGVAGMKRDERPKRPKIDVETFPFPPKEVIKCDLEGCKTRKVETRLGACKHDVEKLLKGVGAEYTATWLWRESLKWHPDKWVRYLAIDFLEGKRIVTEMFVIVKALADEKREAEGNATGSS